MTKLGLRLHVLCEDPLHRGFVEQLCERAGIGPRQRTLRIAPCSRGSAADFVLANFIESYQLWRAQSHDLRVGLLVVVDGDAHGLERRRRQLAERLATAGEPTLAELEPRVAVLVPTWHMETWIAWLCGHRPIDEATRYKSADPSGRAVGRMIEDGDYSVRKALAAWTPPQVDEPLHVPSLTHARKTLARLGFPA